MKRLLSTAAAAAVVLASTGVLVSGLTETAGAYAAKAHHHRPTPFGMRANGFGTQVKGGQAPVTSATTAFGALGCTNKAGLSQSRYQANVTLPGLGTISGMKTRIWTTKHHGVVSSWSRQTLGQVVLSDSPLGKLVLKAVSTTARAYHDAHGFHATTDAKLARLLFQPPIGPAQTFPIPTPGNPVTIPAFATVTIGSSVIKKGPSRAAAWANGLKVELLATQSLVRVAHTNAKISAGVRHGLFRGHSAALGGNAAAGVLHVGRTPLSLLPCPGTGGKVQTKSLAGLDLGGQISVGALSSQQMADQNARRSWGFERGKVASINLGGGALTISGIVGQANVSRTGGKVVRSARGSTIGRILVNGQRQTVPDTGVLEVPGIAKLEPKVVTKTRSGIRVVGLRITLLDGSGAVLDLGQAKLTISRSGL